MAVVAALTRREAEENGKGLTSYWRQNLVVRGEEQRKAAEATAHTHCHLHLNYRKIDECRSLMSWTHNCLGCQGFDLFDASSCRQRGNVGCGEPRVVQQGHEGGIRSKGSEVNDSER